MRAVANNRNFLKKAIACVASFTLAFTLFGTPAYAAEATLAEPESETPVAIDSTLQTLAPTEEAVVEAETPDPEALEPEADKADPEAADDAPQVVAEEASSESDGSDTEQRDPVEEGKDPLPNCSLSLTSSYNEESFTFTYSVSITNSGTAPADLSLSSQVTVGTSSSSLDLPATLTLAPGEERVFTVSVDAASFEDESGRVNVVATVVANDAQGREAFARTADTCMLPLHSSYKVDAVAELFDQNGSMSEEGIVRVGNVVRFTFTLTNDGETTLEGVSAAPVTQELAMQDNWAEVTTLAPGESRSFVGTYTVGQVDIDPELGYQEIIAAADISVNGETRSYTKEGGKVFPTFGYTVNYYKNTVSEENFLGSDAGEDVLDTEIPYVEGAYLPQGYTATGVRLEGETFIGPDAEYNVLNVVYTGLRADVGYTINYYAGSKEGKFLGSVQGTGVFGQTITLDDAQLNAKLPAEGYLPKTAGETQSFILTANASENTIDVVYERGVYDYTILFYLDSAANEEFRVGAPITGTAEYGTNVHLSADLLNTYLPEEGYLSKAQTDELDLEISADPQRNTVKVVYDRASFDYTVNYYKDSVSPENLIKSVVDQARYHTTVFDIPLNAYLPSGYQMLTGSVDLEQISADPAENVVNVVYSKRTDIAYTINYYQDSISENNLLGSDRAYGTFEDEIVPEEGKYAPVGYNRTGAISGATHISANPLANELNVVYTRGTLSYRVNYYKDSVAEGNLVGSEEGQGVYLSAIPYNAAKFVPTGYSLEKVSTSGVSTVGADEAQNVLNVVFTRETNIGYTVNYYAGSLDGSGQFLGSVPGYGTFGDTISFDSEAFLPRGYALPAQISGVQTIGANAEENIVNVVYPYANYSYTVNYYKDSVALENLVGTDAGVAAYRSSIPYELGAHLPTGYSAQGTVLGPSTVSYDPTQNVLNVVYSPNRYTYTVNYYVGSVSSENRIASQTREAQPYGTLVNLSAAELNQQRPEGYSMLTQGRELAITEIEANNVVNVVFYPLDTPVQEPEDPGIVEPDDPTAPQDPSNTTNSTPETNPTPSQGITNNASASIDTAGMPLVNPTAEVPEATYNATAVRDALNFVQDPLTSSDETTIEDDTNPLASSPNAQKQGAVGYILLILAALLAAGALITLYARKRALVRLSDMNGTAVSLMNTRVRHLLQLAVGFTVSALAMYLLWVALLI